MNPEETHGANRNLGGMGCSCVKKQPGKHITSVPLILSENSDSFMQNSHYFKIISYRSGGYHVGIHG